MKVKDLIKALGHEDPEAEVLLDHDEGGLYELNEWASLVVYRSDTGTLLKHGDIHNEKFGSRYWRKVYQTDPSRLSEISAVLLG